MQGNLGLLAERLAWESTSWTTVEIRAITTETAPKSPGGVAESVYIETAKGQRFQEERIRLANDTQSHQIRFFDGERGGGILFDRQNIERQNQAVLRSSFGGERPGNFTMRPFALQFRYLIQEPLHLSLKRGRELEVSRVIGRECIPVRFDDALRIGGQPPRDLIYHLDRATGVPLKVEVATDGVPLWTWTARSLEKVQNWHVVKSSEFVYSLPDNQKHTRNETIQLITFNQTYADSTFTPRIEEHVLVRDEVNRKLIQPAKNDQAASNVGSAAMSGNPITATPPVTWESWTGPALLIGGLLLLTAAITLAVGKLKRA